LLLRGQTGIGFGKAFLAGLYRPGKVCILVNSPLAVAKEY
jgi:hypothetical protein